MGWRRDGLVAVEVDRWTPGRVRWRWRGAWRSLHVCLGAAHGSCAPVQATEQAGPIHGCDWRWCVIVPRTSPSARAEGGCHLIVRMKAGEEARTPDIQLGNPPSSSLKPVLEWSRLVRLFESGLHATCATISATATLVDRAIPPSLLSGAGRCCMAWMRGARAPACLLRRSVR